MEAPLARYRWDAVSNKPVMSTQYLNDTLYYYHDLSILFVMPRTSHRPKFESAQRILSSLLNVWTTPTTPYSQRHYPWSRAIRYHPSISSISLMSFWEGFMDLLCCGKLLSPGMRTQRHHYFYYSPALCCISPATPKPQSDRPV